MNSWSMRTYYNKLAFIEVFGDINDPGAYVKFKSNYFHNVNAYTGNAGSTRNPATPCRADFCCDVDNIINSVIHDDALLKKFVAHYMTGDENLTREQQHQLEQRIGKELRRKGLIPVNRYFVVKRR